MGVKSYRDDRLTTLLSYAVCSREGGWAVPAASQRPRLLSCGAFER